MVRGYKAYAKAAKKAQRMVLLQPEKPSHGDRTCLPYAIDRQQGDLTLTDITRAGLSFLMSKQGEKQGFFLMVEGGKIDYACHANDAATVFHETIDMDEAVRVAYEFYMQHPDETLIVVTADHETGGIVLGRGPYELHLDVLKYQKPSTTLPFPALSISRSCSSRRRASRMGVRLTPSSSARRSSVRTSPLG